MKNVRRAVTASAMIVGLAAAGSATALAQPTGSLGGSDADIRLSQGSPLIPGGCAVDVENVGSETAEGVNVRSVDCAIFPFPIPFYGSTSNGDANLLDNFVLVSSQSGAPNNDE